MGIVFTRQGWVICGQLSLDIRPLAFSEIGHVEESKKRVQGAVANQVQGLVK